MNTSRIRLAISSPRASASFDARRLASFRKLLSQVRAEGNPSYAAQVEQECRRLAAGLIAGEPVEA